MFPWEVEDVFADMRLRPSVQAMVQAYLGVKPPKEAQPATRATARAVIAAMGQRG